MRLIRAYLATYTPTGRLWAALGLITLAAAALMSWDFGWSISAKHALFLSCMTAIAAFLPEAAYAQWHRGRWGAAVVLALVCAPLLAIEFYTHAGYTAGLRGSNIETARVQNTRYDAAQEAVTDDRANLAMWRDQLAKLQQAHAWAATVKADGLRAQLASADKAIALETERGGCKTRCLALMQDKARLEERIAIAEKAADLTTRIEATQRLLDGKRERAAVVEHKSSAVAHQNDFLARAVALVTAGSLRPTELVSEGAQQSVNLAMALAGTGLPALALFVAGLYRVRRADDVPHPRAAAPALARNHGMASQAMAAGAAVTHHATPAPVRLEVVHSPPPPPPPQMIVAGVDAVGPMHAAVSQRDIWSSLARVRAGDMRQWCRDHGLDYDSARSRALAIAGQR